MSDNKNIIKFYSTHDLSLGRNLMYAGIALDQYDSKKTLSINDVLKYFNIIKLLSTNIPHTEWTNEQYEKYKSLIPALKKSIHTYTSSLNNDNIIDTYKITNIHYQQDFWELFEHNKLYNNISVETFNKLLYWDTVFLNQILKHKNTVLHYDYTIKTYMTKNNIGGNCLIDHYLSSTKENPICYNFPDSLSLEDKSTLIDSYIESETVNLKHLEILSYANSTKDFYISDQTKLSAKLKLNEKINELFTNNSGSLIKCEFSFQDTEDSLELHTISKRNFKLTYNKNWITNNLDYPTLLNNLIYLFGYTDLCCRSTFTSQQSNNSIVDFIFGIKGKKIYPTNIAFDFSNQLSTYQLIAYSNILQANNIHLEEIFKWFFNDYLTNEFNVDGFHFTPPSIGSSYLEKCRTICPEIDSILKQFNIYIKNKYIDRNPLEITSSTPKFRQINSFSKNKYAYLIDKKHQIAMNLFFSDQSVLSYTKKQMILTIYSPI